MTNSFADPETKSFLEKHLNKKLFVITMNIIPDTNEVIYKSHAEDGSIEVFKRAHIWKLMAEDEAKF